MAEARHVGFIRLSPDFLAQLLQLPAGHHVINARWHMARDDELQLLVDGESMPLVPYGQMIPEVRPTCRTAPSVDAVLQLEWPLISLDAAP